MVLQVGRQSKINLFIFIEQGVKIRLGSEENSEIFDISQ